LRYRTRNTLLAIKSSQGKLVPPIIGDYFKPTNCSHFFEHSKNFKDDSSIKGHYNKPIVKSKQTSIKPDTKHNTKLIYTGANCRSLISNENYYFLHKILRELEPDVLFLNETWNRNKEGVSIQDRRYQTFFSSTDDMVGGGVAIIYKRELIIKPLFPELHTKNLILGRLSSQNSDPVLLLCCYIPPDYTRRIEALSHLARIFDFLHQRYSTFSVLGFSDLNVDLLAGGDSPSFRRTLRTLQHCGLVSHHSLSTGSQTRVQGSKYAYLDYFLSKDVLVKDVEVKSRFGKSDHYLITCSAESIVPVRRRKNLIFSRVRATRILYQILRSEEDLTGLLSKSPLELFRTLSAKLKCYSLIPESTP